MISLTPKAGDGRTRRSSSSTPALATAAEKRRGPYRLCLQLAAGGMATVYLGSSSTGVGPHRFVAVKVIHPHLANDPEFVEMFVDEAEIAARMRHPNVCAVYDFEGAPGAQYIAMEYLVGEPLREVHRRLARGHGTDLDRLTRHVAHALAQACEGLHAAHELSDADGEPLCVVHRDVSPENVFLTYDGVTKLVDFGVASAVRKRHRTSTGVVKGKVGYMAPEVARGLKPDRRTDVWGVGVIAWELLTGQRLFRRENDLETLRAVLAAPIAAPSQARPGLSPEIDAVVMRALAREPADRYATARELGVELAKLAAVGERPVGPSDLGEWLAELFPGGRARHEQIIDLAAQLDAEAEERGSIATAIAPTPAPQPPVRRARAMAAADDDDRPTRIHEARAPAPPRASVGTARTTAVAAPRPAWVGALLVGIGVSLGLVGGEVLRRAPAAGAVPGAGASDLAAAPTMRASPSASVTAPTVTAAASAETPNEIVIHVRLEPSAPEPETVPAGAATPASATRTSRGSRGSGSPALDELAPYPAPAAISAEAPRWRR